MGLLWLVTVDITCMYIVGKTGHIVVLYSPRTYVAFPSYPTDKPSLFAYPIPYILALLEYSCIHTDVVPIFFSRRQNKLYEMLLKR